MNDHLNLKIILAFVAVFLFFIIIMVSIATQWQPGASSTQPSSYTATADFKASTQIRIQQLNTDIAKLQQSLQNQNISALPKLKSTVSEDSETFQQLLAVREHLVQQHSHTHNNAIN